jgi:hypothetical protein
VTILAFRRSNPAVRSARTNLGGSVCGAAAAEDSAVLSSVSVIFCDECDSATTLFVRGWRAYLSVQPSGVVVLCPACAERLTGEDEPDDDD